MPSIAQWILGGLAWALTSAVGKIMSSFGLAFVISNVVVGDWISEIADQWGGLPDFMVEMLAFFGVDVAISIVLSAYGIRLAAGRIRGLMARGGAMSGFEA